MISRNRLLPGLGAEKVLPSTCSWGRSEEGPSAFAEKREESQCLWNRAALAWEGL